MSGNALKSAREGLAQAQSFQAEQNGKPLSAEERQTLGRMTDHVLDAADQHRQQVANARNEHTTAAGLDKAAELRAERERALPESLKGAPTKSERLIQAAKERRPHSEVFDFHRAGRFAELAAAGATREELALHTRISANTGSLGEPDDWETFISSEFRAIEGVSQVTTPLVTDHARTIYVNTRTGTHPGTAITHTTDVSTYQVAEQGAYRGDAEDTYGRAVLECYKYLQKQSVSSEVIEDTPINIAQEAATPVARWFAELREQGLTNGTGAAQPQGVFNNPPTTQEVATAAAGTPTLADVVKLMKNPVASRNGYSFLLNRDVWADIVAAQTGVNWGAVYMGDDGFLRMFGFPVVFGMFVNTTTQQNANPVGFGNWNSALATRMTNMRITATTHSGIQFTADTDDITFRFKTHFASAWRNREYTRYLSVSA